MRQNHQVGGWCCVSAYKVFRLGKLWAWCSWRKSWCQNEGFLKKKSCKEEGLRRKVSIPAGGKTLEVGEDPGDQRAAWKRMSGGARRPWPIMPKSGNWEQLYSTEPTQLSAPPSQMSNDLAARKGSWDPSNAPGRKPVSESQCEIRR